VAAVLTKEVGSVRVDKRTKTLIVTDLPHNMPRVQQLVEAFDQSFQGSLHRGQKIVAGRPQRRFSVGHRLESSVRRH